MKKKTVALTMAALMAVSLTAYDGGAERTTAATIAADTTTADTADTMVAEDAETSAEVAEAEATGGILVMATNTEFPLYEYHGGGEIVGIDAEIAKVIASELGMELGIEDIAFGSIIPEITSGEADMGLTGVTVTESRKQSVDPSDTYAKASQKVTVKEDSEIASPDDPVGKIIGVQLGTTGSVYVSDLKVNGTTVERCNKSFEAVQALNQGKIDAVVIDGEPTKTFAVQTKGSRILEESFTNEGYAIVIKKGSTELLDKINGALRTLKENDTLDEIVTRYIEAE